MAIHNKLKNNKHSYTYSRHGNYGHTLVFCNDHANPKQASTLDVVSVESS